MRIAAGNPFRRDRWYYYFPTAVRWLMISNVALFLLAYIGGPAVQQPMMLGALVPQLVVHSFPWFTWQLVTYLFLHASGAHVLFNMLALWMFGTPLELDWGTRRFLKYYFICGIGAGICDVVVNVALGNNTRTVGASGAIYGLLLAFGVLYPEQTVLMNFLFPIKAKYMVWIYGTVALLASIDSNSRVSNIAHLGGMLFGYVYLKVRLPSWRLPALGAAFRQWRQQRARKKFQVYMRKRGGGPWVN